MDTYKGVSFAPKEIGGRAYIQLEKFGGIVSIIKNRPMVSV